MIQLEGFQAHSSNMLQLLDDFEHFPYTKLIRLPEIPPSTTQLYFSEFTAILLWNSIHLQFAPVYLQCVDTSKMWMQQYLGAVIGILLPSGLRFKNISFETRCATCSPQLLQSSFDRPAPCLVNSTLIQPISGIWKDAIMSWEAVVVPSWMLLCVCVQLA